MLESDAGPLEANTATILEDLEGAAIVAARIEPVLDRVGTAARSLVPGLVAMTIRLNDGSTRQWSEIDPVVETRDVARILEVPLGDGVADTGGVLELHFDSEETHPGALVELVGLAVSSSARLAVLEAKIGQLGEAVETRDIIGQAKGVIMARKGCGPVEAFDVLSRASQRTQRKLRDLSAEVVASVRPPTTQGGVRA